jgi:hypothetical protein
MIKDAPGGEGLGVVVGLLNEDKEEELKLNIDYTVD